MDQTMILSAVGLGIVVLLLVFLAIYQQRLAKRAAHEKIKQLRSEPAAMEVQSPGSTPFFVGCYHGSSARFFRVYVDAGRLLFLLAGPYFVMIDADAARGDSGKHWLLRSLKLLAITLTSGLVAAAIVFAAVTKGISLTAGGLQGGGHFVAVILGIICLLALTTVILVPAVLWRLDRRGKELDVLPLSRLRELAEVEDRSFVASPANVPELTLSLLDKNDLFHRSANVSAVITFTHAETGKWKIETQTTRDTRAAIEMAYTVWSNARVHVVQSLVDRLARTVEAGELAIGSLDAQLQPLVAQAQPRVTLEDHHRAAAAEAEKKRRAEAPKIGDPGSTFSMNGIGTMVCDGRGIVEWDYFPGDSDALLAFCFLGIPIVPYKAVHACHWGPGVDLGSEYQSHPIRWTWGLAAAAYLRRIWAVLVGVGVVLLFISYIKQISLLGALLTLPGDAVAEPTWLDRMPIRVLVGAIGLLLIGGATFARWRVDQAEKRHRAIRRLLGRHVIGSSDPAYWPRDLLQKLAMPHIAMGSPSFAEAVALAMDEGDYRKAMFAARLSTALEDGPKGDALTDLILQNQAVKRLVQEIHANPKQYEQLMPPSDWQPEELFVA